MKKCIAILLSVLFVLCLASCGGPKEVSDMSLSVVLDEIPMNGLFTGTIAEKLPNGQGTFTYSDDSIAVSYTGNWENGNPIGIGTLTYTGFEVKYGDSTYAGKYEGQSVGGLPNGEGNFISGDEFIYTGNWKDGTISGNGKLEISNLSIQFNDRTLAGKFNGEVVDGLPCGTGEFSVEGEEHLTYSGNWKDGTISGNGKLEISNLSIQFNDRTLAGKFNGEVVDGLPCGTGEFSVEGEEYLTYSGNWKDGVFSGIGTIDSNFYTVHFLDGIDRTGKYVGAVNDGLAEGKGTFSAVNDAGISYTYTGEWKNGLYNGQGVCRWDTDSAYIQKGTFVDGEFVPTPLEYFIAEGTLKEDQYTIIEKAQEFLKNNPDLFLTNDLSLYEGEIDKNFKYKAFSKNQSTYGDKLVVVTGRIGQIIERTRWGADHTFCLIYDDSYNYYFVNMYGFADGIYEGDRVTMTALPLDYFTWTSTDGDLVWSIACAAVSLKK